MPNRNIIFMQGLKVSPNEEPQEFDAELSNLRNAIESVEAFGHIKPFGESAININYNALGKSSDLRFNRTIIDGNGKQQAEIYGTFYLSYRTLALPSPDEIAMYKHLFSLEECAKPILSQRSRGRSYARSEQHPRSRPEIYHSPHRHAVVHTTGHSFAHLCRPRQKQRLHTPLPDLRLSRYREDNLGAESVRRDYVRPVQQDGKIAIQVQ